MKNTIFKLFFAAVLVTGTAFAAGAQTTRAFYDNKGRIRFTVDYYSEKELPKEVRAIVKPVYYDYAILGVQEVKVKGKSVYLIDMEDSTRLKTVRVADGEMEEVSDLRRSDAPLQTQHGL
jgi:hypothetical protein